MNHLNDYFYLKKKKNIINNENTIIEYIKFIIKEKNKTQLNENEKEVIKKLLEFNVYKAITYSDFLSNNITFKENLYLYLKNLNIINDQYFHSNTFISNSFINLNTIKQQIKNKTIKIGNFKKLTQIQKKYLSNKLLLIYDEREINQKLAFISQINDKIFNIQNIIYTIDDICRLFYFEGSKYFQDNIELKVKFIEDNEINILDNDEFNKILNRNEKIVEDYEEYLDFVNSIVFQNIFREMNKQRKDITIQEVLKFSLNKYKDLYNKIIKNTCSIEEIELYFANYNDEIEKSKVMKLDVFQDYNVMIQIFDKINLIINKDIIENDLDKILEFFSIFKIKENNLMLKIEEIKTTFSNKISKENIDNIIGDIDSLDILSKKDEFNIFMRELINIKNLLKIFKEFSS